MQENGLYDTYGTVTAEGFVPATISDQRPAMTLLSRFAVIEVAGPDSARFLQGQLTCDVVNMDADHWLAGACCTAKGRMVANFVIVRTEAGYLLRLPAAQADVLLNHLKKYAVFFKATLNVRSDLVIVGELGEPDTKEVAERTVTSTDADNSAVRLNWGGGRTEYWVSDATTLLSDQPLCAEQSWAEQDIREGWLWVLPSSVEAWVPQYCDWHIKEGISFTKGCYTGQEVVARLQYLGKTKRHLYLVESAENLPDVMTSVSLNGKAIGELGAATNSTGLAVLSSEEDTITAELDGAPATFTRLFYTE